MTIFRIHTHAVLLFLMGWAPLSADNNPSAAIAPYVIETRLIRQMDIGPIAPGAPCYSHISPAEGDPAKIISDTPPEGTSLEFTWTASADVRLANWPETGGRCETYQPGRVDVTMEYEEPIFVHVSCWIEGNHENTFPDDKATSKIEISSKTVVSNMIECIEHLPSKRFTGEKTYQVTSGYTYCFSSKETTISFLFMLDLEAYDGSVSQRAATRARSESHARLDFRGAC